MSLYYAVRDGIRYNPFLDFADASVTGPRRCLEANGEGFCVGKAALLAACARAVGIPARVGFADVKNHLTTPRARRARWAATCSCTTATPSCSSRAGGSRRRRPSTCRCARASACKPLEFDGREDSIFHPFDEDDRRHMEYLRDRGVHADVPVEEIQRAFREAYPKFYRLGAAATKETFTPG